MKKIFFAFLLLALAMPAFAAREAARPVDPYPYLRDPAKYKVISLLATEITNTHDLYRLATATELDRAIYDDLHTSAVDLENLYMRIQRKLRPLFGKRFARPLPSMRPKIVLTDPISEELLLRIDKLILRQLEINSTITNWNERYSETRLGQYVAEAAKMRKEINAVLSEIPMLKEDER